MESINRIRFYRNRNRELSRRHSPVQLSRFIEDSVRLNVPCLETTVNQFSKQSKRIITVDHEQGLIKWHALPIAEGWNMNK